jgi:hypothetical protein
MWRIRLFVKVPLVDELGDLKLTMIRMDSSKPRNLPRIGERMYLLPELSPKVADIQYSGINLWLTTIILEPISASYEKDLEKIPKRRGTSGWSKSSGRSFGSYFL